MPCSFISSFRAPVHLPASITLEFKTQSGSLLLRANGRVKRLGPPSALEGKHLQPSRYRAMASDEVSRNLGKRISIPKEVLRLGDIYYIR